MLLLQTGGSDNLLLQDGTNLLLQPSSTLACNPLFGGGATANPLWGFLA